MTPGEQTRNEESEHFAGKWNHLPSHKCGKNNRIERLTVSRRNGNRSKPVAQSRNSHSPACRSRGSSWRTGPGLGQQGTPGKARERWLRIRRARTPASSPSCSSGSGVGHVVPFLEDVSSKLNGRASSRWRPARGWPSGDLERPKAAIRSIPCKCRDGRTDFVATSWTLGRGS
jgi:hypothetical protein